MNSFDTILVAPPRGQLEAVLYEAVDALHRDLGVDPLGHEPRFDVASRGSLEMLWAAMEFDAEGCRLYPLRGSEARGQPRASLLVAWWCDYLRRRHVRVVGGLPDRMATVPTPGPSRPPLACIYPASTALRVAHGRSELRVVCVCGAAGTPAALGWMGPCCGPCADRDAGEPAAPCSWHDHHASITALAVSADGRRMASADDGGLVLVRDLATGAVTDRRERQGRLTKLAFASGGEVFTGRTSILGLADPFAFAPGGGLFSYTPWNRNVVLTEDNERRLFAVPDGMAVADLAVSPDGQTLAACGGEGGVCLWHVPSGQARETLAVSHCAPPLTFSPEGRYLAVPVRTHRASLLLYDLAARRWGAGNQGAPFLMHAYAITPDATGLIHAEDDRVLVFDIPGGVERWSVSLMDDDPIRALTLTPDGQWVVLGRQSGAVAFWPMSLLGVG